MLQSGLFRLLKILSNKYKLSQKIKLTKGTEDKQVKYA